MARGGSGRKQEQEKEKKGPGCQHRGDEPEVRRQEPGGLARTNFRKLGPWAETGLISRDFKFPSARRCHGDGDARHIAHARARGPERVTWSDKMAASRAVEEMRSRVVLGEFGVRNVCKAWRARARLQT